VGTQQAGYLPPVQRYVNMISDRSGSAAAPACRETDFQIPGRYDGLASVHQKEACRFLRWIMTQITTGDPTMEVTALIGRVAVAPGSRATISQASKSRAPVNKVAGISVR